MVYDRVGSDDESELSVTLDSREWHGEPGRDVDHDALARLVTDHDEPLPSSPVNKATSHNGPVAWRDLPRKQQLFVITLARMSEPLVQSSLQV